MSFFEERQKQKKALEDEAFIKSFQNLAGAVLGEKTEGIQDSERLHLIRIIEELGRYLDICIPYSSHPDLSVEWYQEEYFRPQGIMWRKVHLSDFWYRNVTGIMLGEFADGERVVLFPSGIGGYCYKDPRTGSRIRITKKNAGLFKPEATLYYRTLPIRPIGKRDVAAFIRKCVSIPETLMLIAATAAVMVLGMVTPAMTKLLLSDVAVSGDLRMLNVILAILLIITGASFVMTSIKQLLLARLSTKVAVPLQAAFMMRILTAPAGELKHFTAGDMGNRIGSMYNNMKTLLNMFLSILLTAVCSLLCFIQMFVFAPGPAGIALIITAVLAALYTLILYRQTVISADRMSAQAEEAGLTYSLIDGMAKITLSGAEKRAFSVWADVYRKSIRTLYNPPLLLKISGMLTPVIMLAGTMLLYLTAVTTHVSQADFYAFLSSYGILTSAMTMISSGSSRFAAALPVFRMLEPVMRCDPESDSEKEVVQNLKGDISFQNVTFGYVDHMPPVLENLNLDIHAGEYVAIVGATGCGKSTIVRLMLGFETPDHGGIYYDGKNIKSLDLTSLRRNIGTVLQNGEVFQGTIYSNITIAGTGLTEEDAWEAARIAGIADDIDRMPMKMNTPLPDGGRGVSGGQLQRLLIARAIVSKPKILIFDEATSALDNITQKAVSEALGTMQCTRIVIAHRLSTVQNCDRILCLEKGGIVEEGTYDGLIKKDGFFAELVRRQRL